jgi:hypothetical protein
MISLDSPLTIALGVLVVATALYLLWVWWVIPERHRPGRRRPQLELVRTDDPLAAIGDELVAAAHRRANRRRWWQR